MLFDPAFEAGNRQGTRRLGNRTGIVEDIANRSTDLVDTDRHDFIHQLAHNLKRACPNLPHGDTVGEESNRSNIDRCTAASAPARQAASSGSTPMTRADGET